VEKRDYQCVQYRSHKVFFFLILVESKEERKRKGYYTERKNRKTGRHLFPIKKEFVFIYFVFFFGE